MYLNTIGIDNFREIRENKLTYIDKTNFIANLVTPTPVKVALFTRPRRFGKTLTLSMLEEFFDISKDSQTIFSNLNIAFNINVCKQWMNQYPVISLSFKDLTSRDYTQALEIFSELIFEICAKHTYLLKSSQIDEVNKNKFNKLYSQEGSQVELQRSIKYLCYLLHNYWNRPVILLIDEYDVPLNYAYNHNYYAEMLDFIRGLLSAALKNNQNLKFAVLTGCLKIAKESIFTGVNNFKNYSITDTQFADTFGFTDQEVDHLLKITNLSDKKPIFKEWYDGYSFGKKTSIYCPWDVINYVYALSEDAKAQPKLYWIDTSSNNIIKKFITNEKFNINNQVETLLAGDFIESPLIKNITYSNIYSSVDHFWNILYATGYLTTLKDEESLNFSEQNLPKLKLIIPNKEIEEIFKYEVMALLKNKLKNLDKKELLKAFWNDDACKLSSIISNILKNTISFYDYHENFYHAFILGLFTIDGYILKSNLETGLGRADIIILDRENSRGAVIEIKKSANNPFKLKNKALEALKQIQDQDYTNILNNEVTIIRSWGLAFAAKNCLAVCNLN